MDVAMGEPELKRMTADEFLHWQQDQDRNYELVDGLPVPFRQMEAGSLRAHDRIVVNVLSALHSQVRGTRRCAATKNIAIQLPEGSLRRSDALIVSTDTELTSTLARDPELSVDILTPGRVRFSDFRKIDEYKTVPCLAHILLIASEKFGMTLHSRSADGWTSQSFTAPGAIVDMPAIGCTLSARDIYEGLPFAE